MNEFSGKRRLTTILAADVVSYSKHMSKNEEGTLRTLQRLMTVIEPVVDTHNGRIFDTAGDAFLAEFKSTVEAVRAAIQIQEAIELANQAPDVDPKLDFRIGINVGDVIDEEGRLYGDGINVACRLEGLAKPGNICVSGSVYELVKNKLSYRFHAMGEQHVKNISEPISTFSLLSDYDMGIVSPVDLEDNAGKNESRLFSLAKSRDLPIIILFILLALAMLAGLFLLNFDESGTPADSQPEQAQQPNLGGKWLVGTDDKQNAGIAVELLNNQNANIVLHNLKTQKTQRLKKTGSWQINDDNELCVRIPVKKHENCFELKKNEKGFQLINNRLSDIDWLLVDDTRF